MPGKHNSSSIEGGIFGAADNNNVARAPAGPGVSEAFFGAAVQQAPGAAREAVTKSSVEGGIFAEQVVTAPDGGRVGITKSSIDGGVFGGYNHVEAPRNRAPMPAADRGVAGSAIVKGDALKLDWNENAAPQTQPPLSARNSNQSSIEGGIFGAAPAAVKPEGRRNPNQSSIEGGIFG